MILADSFCLSEKARQNEFTTNLMDTPLITQFAANTVHDFVGAAYLVSPYCNGVNLNCGCPQRWARELCLGCEMLKEPQKVYDIVRQCRNHIQRPFTVSVKMRLLKDTVDSVEIARQLEKCGVDFITVHARTPSQSIGDIDTQALAQIKGSTNIPVVGNGGVTNLKEVELLQQDTRCDGVMVANGILTNPAIFSDASITPLDCIQNWVDICYNTTLTADAYGSMLYSKTISERPSNLTFQCFHHHLVFMLEKLLPRRQKRIFNNLKSFSSVLEYLEAKFNVTPQLYEFETFTKYVCLKTDYSKRDILYRTLKPVDLICDKNVSCYDWDNSDGKYFNSKKEECQSGDCDWSDMFLENG